VAVLHNVDVARLVAANIASGDAPDGGAANQAPALQGRVDDQIVAQGHAFSLDLPVDLFTDADGDVLTYSATLADGGALPTWLSFDAATGHFGGTPGAADAGRPASVLDIVVTATDSAGASASEAFSLSVLASRTVNGTGRADTLVGDLADERFNGQGGNDTISAAGGDDTLDGGTGADRLVGGSGDDRYIVDNARDVVVELAGEGNDRVDARVSTTLAANVEQLVLIGTGRINGNGNALDNLIVGNARDNQLDGKGGADRLAGGEGQDTLTGGAGADVFVFDTALDGRSNVDRVSDFDAAFDLIELDAAVFTAFAGQGAVSAGMLRSGAGVNRALDADDHLLYDTSSGSLYYDADGLGGAAAVRFARIEGGVQLTVDDLRIGGHGG
jgi:Ca2+-binding RTX toxin-like protein